MARGGMQQMSDKQAVRREVLAARRAMSTAERDTADRALMAGAVDLVRGMAIVAAFVPMPGEPGGAGLPDGLAAVVSTVLLPVLLPDRDLDWAQYQGPDSLGGPGGGPALLREPSGPRLGPDAVASVDALLVPALAVDRTGVRLGRGGGSFDRALARVGPDTAIVALLYDGELRVDLPAESHDRRVTAVITPSGLWRR
jgi:5-formyltetrahydrofolate cyclo-ligase